MSDLLAVAHAYEDALFAGKMDEVASLFTDDITYWVAGDQPLGGERHGPAAVIQAFAGATLWPQVAVGVLNLAVGVALIATIVMMTRLASRDC